MVAGYLRPHDRPPMNNIGFQPPAPNALPTGGPISGDISFGYATSVSLKYMSSLPSPLLCRNCNLVMTFSGHVMPCRPDVTALNWRPA